MIPAKHVQTLAFVAVEYTRYGQVNANNLPTVLHTVCPVVLNLVGYNSGVIHHVADDAPIKNNRPKYKAAYRPDLLFGPTDPKII